MRSGGGVAAALSVRRMAGTRPLDPSSVIVLAAIDPASLAAEDRVDLIRAWERAAAMVAGYQQEALAAVVDATTALGLEGDAARHEVGAALRLSPVTAAERTRVAAAVRDRLPTTLAALRRGEISWRQAAHLVAGVDDLSDELAAAVESRVLGRMRDQTAAETRRAVQAAVVAVDPSAAARRHEKAVAERSIERMPQSDGMTSWWVPLSADLEHDMWLAVSATATADRQARRAAGADDPGLDALRVDALVRAVLGPAVPLPGAVPSPTQSVSVPADQLSEQADGDASTETRATINIAAMPTDRTSMVSTPVPASASDRGYVPRCSCGGRQTAAVVIDLPTALGLADNPGFVSGHGAVPGPLARRMAADRDWVRWTRDPGTRAIVDRGTRSYRPTETIKAWLVARDTVCGFPGCNLPAQGCDCDHVVNHREGGATSSANLGPLCRSHHNAKTHQSWRLQIDPMTARKTWRSPLGKTYLKASTPLLT